MAATPITTSTSTMKSAVSERVAALASLRIRLS